MFIQGHRKRDNNLVYKMYMDSVLHSTMCRRHSFDGSTLGDCDRRRHELKLGSGGIRPHNN